jgi:outer membrane cobalamin receptor
VLPVVSVEASPIDACLPARTEVGREELLGSHKSELTDVLELTPGVNVRQGGRGEPRMDVRGLDQRAVLFTLNGVPVYEPYNGIVNLDLFPLEMLGGVELARGPSSSLFGPGGLAGTVKMSAFEPTRPLAGSLTTIWREPRTWDLRASAGTRQGDLSAAVGGRFYTTPGFPLSGDFGLRRASRQRFEDGGLRLNSDREEKSAFADLGWRYSEEGSLHATFLGSLARFGIPPGTAEFAPVFRRNDHQELDHLQVSADQSVGPSAGLGAALFDSRYLTRESQFDSADFTTPILSTRADSSELGGLARASFDLSDQDSLTVAGQLRQAEADISDSVRGTLSQPHFTTASLALENAYSLTARVRLLAGLSYDVQTGGGRGTVWELNPQGGVAVDFGRFGTSRAAVARKVRFPTLRELFDPLEGNPDLQPEKALSYEVGHRLEAKRFYIDASLFRLEVEELIAKQGGDLRVSMNLEEALIQGFEVAAGGLPFTWLRLDLNYTYLDARARDASATGRDDFFEVQHKPAHRFNGVLQLFLSAEFTLRVEGLYTSEQVERFATDVEVGPAGLMNVQLIKGLGRHAELFGGVDNVFDEDWEEKLGFPGPGRWGYAGLTLRY